MNKKIKFRDSFNILKREIRQYKIIIFLAILLSIVAAYLSILSPNYLKELTNEIAKGIKPNEKNINLVIKGITNNIKRVNVNELMADEKVSIEDKRQINKIINKKMDIKDINISAYTINKVFKEFEIYGVIVTGNDQYEVLKIKDVKNIKYLNKLPKNIEKIISPRINMDAIKKIFIMLVLLYSFHVIFNLVDIFLMTDMANKFAKDLRRRVILKINELPLSFFDSHQTGDLLSRITNDVDVIATSLGESLKTISSSVVLLLGTVIMMFISNNIMAITAILSSFLGIFFVMIILFKSQKYVVESQEILGILNSHVEEMYSGYVVVKTSNGKETSISKFKELNDRLYLVNMKAKFLTGLMGPSMMFLNYFGYVAVSVVGAYLVSKNIIGFGSIIAFMAYVRLFANPLSQLGQVLGTLQMAIASTGRVFSFLNETEMAREDHLERNDKILKSDVIFKNVYFKYNADKDVISDFSANIKKGQKIAIVGPTGAGKTTLVNLLMKFYEVDSGDIIIGGKSIKDLKREDVHNLFTMVLQDTWLFDGTIRENISFNNKASDAEIMKALELVGLAHFVNTLPDGLETKVLDSDALSAGQKQLMTIARASLYDKPMVILDEATSNVDTRTEELVQEAMDKLMDGKTSFIIAHRLSTIKNADLILVINDGNIVEQGKHENLLKKNGYYAKMYNSQFELK